MRDGSRIGRRSILAGLGGALLFILLTAVTEVGGLVLIASVAFTRYAFRESGLRRTARLAAHVFAFAFLYALAVTVVLPGLAPLAGRDALACTVSDAEAPVAALSPLTCLLNRHYAVPAVHEAMRALAADLHERFPATELRYLDAAFPFGLPMLPHLSHGDGRRIDLAFFYRGRAGAYVPGLAPSPIGYWGFEQPGSGDPAPCRDHERWWDLRWNLGWLQPLLPEVTLDEERTGALVTWLVTEGPRHGVARVLLEPHLVARLGSSSPMIRFQGCRAARHDDHIHVDVTG